MPSPPPHPSPLAWGAMGFSDPPPSTPASVNSQKNRWVSAPARACPAFPAPTLLLQAQGWQPSDHPRRSGCPDWSFRRVTQREPGRQTGLLNSHSPPRPNSPRRPPPSSLTDSCLSPHWLQQVTTGSTLVATAKPRASLKALRPRLLGRVVARSSLGAKPPPEAGEDTEWGQTEDPQALSHTPIIHPRVSQTHQFQ